MCPCNLDQETATPQGRRAIVIHGRDDVPGLLPIPPQPPTPDWIAAMPEGHEKETWLWRQEDAHKGYWRGPVGQARLRYALAHGDQQP